jgi:hypothetical protein
MTKSTTMSNLQYSEDDFIMLSALQSAIPHISQVEAAADALSA